MRVIALHAGQAQRLSGYCQTYRLNLLQGQPPSLKRNQDLRAAQWLHARLYHQTDTPDQETDPLLLCQREVQMLQTVLVALLQQQRPTRPGEQCNALVAELADTLLLLRRSLKPARCS